MRGPTGRARAGRYLDLAAAGSPDSFQAEEDTWYFPRVCGTFKERAGWHGCQMPEQLLGRILRACSNPGEVVLDRSAVAARPWQWRRKLQAALVGIRVVGSVCGTN